MNETWNRLASALAKLSVLAVGVYVWVFYLRLGWFLPAAWLAGCFAAVYVTGRERARLRPRALGVAAVLVAYSALQLAVFVASTSQTRQVMPMRWSVSESERGVLVDLEFRDFPGHSVGIYSADLAASLRSREGDEVDVVFRVSKALGCLRGFGVERVGALEDWETSADGYSRARTDDPGPWVDPVWCP